MSASEIIRLVLAVGLVVFLVLWRSGFREWLKEHKKGQRKQEEEQKRAAEKKQARQKALQVKEEYQRRTSQVLKLNLEGLEQKSVGAGSGAIWYLEGGVGNQGPTVLLLHGFAGQKEDWSEFAKFLLRANCYVIAPDLPGFGQNAKNPEGNYEVTTQTKRIRAFAKALDLERVHLVGSSLGGTVAAALTYGAPDQILSLTLIEPFGVRVPYETELDKMLAKERNPLTIANPAAYDNLLGFLFETPPAMSESLKQHLGDEAAKHREFYLKMWPQIRGGDRAHLLDLLMPEIKKKTLVIQGGKSRVVHPATADIIHGMVRGSQTFVLAECGHLPAVEEPEATARRFIEFLNEDGAVATATGAT